MYMKILLLTCSALAVTGAPSSMFTYDFGPEGYQYQQNQISGTTSLGFYMPVSSTSASQQQRHFYVVRDTDDFDSNDFYKYDSDDFYKYDSDDFYDYERSLNHWRDDSGEDEYYESYTFPASTINYDSSNLFKRSLHAGTEDADDSDLETTTFTKYKTNYNAKHDKSSRVFFRSWYQDDDEDDDSFESFESEEDD